MAAGKQYTRELKALGTKTRTPLRPSRSTLEAFPNPSPRAHYTVTLSCPEFTSLCPVTGQPDFGALTIEYAPGALCLESKSLKLYLGSFRSAAAFWEETINRIADDLQAVLRPQWLRVSGVMNPRGGIGITVVAERVEAAS